MEHYELELCQESEAALGVLALMEVDFGLTMAGLAQGCLKLGNIDEYYRTKNHAVSAWESVAKYKGRAPIEMKATIESQFIELTDIIATL